MGYLFLKLCDLLFHSVDELGQLLSCCELLLLLVWLSTFIIPVILLLLFPSCIKCIIVSPIHQIIQLFIHYLLLLPD